MVIQCFLVLFIISTWHDVMDERMDDQVVCEAPAIDNRIFPQQRKLMGSSAQISSGVCRCGLQEQVPEEGSGRFRRVPVCAGVGSGGRFWKVPEGSRRVLV